jgi:hypothetical protein
MAMRRLLISLIAVHFMGVNRSNKWVKLESRISCSAGLYGHRLTAMGDQLLCERACVFGRRCANNDTDIETGHYRVCVHP